MQIIMELKTYLRDEMIETVENETISPPFPY